MVEAYEMMKLYEVVYDGQKRHVEAPSFPLAIEAWKAWARAEWKEDWDGTEEPESVALIGDEPVIRTGQEDDAGNATRLAKALAHCERVWADRGRTLQLPDGGNLTNALVKAFRGAGY